MITQQPILETRRYWVSALIGAAGSVLGSALGLGSQSSANKANMELAKYKYEKDLEMWNRQNAYNTPAAQMQRYATAGINPNTVVSQGSNGNASSAPSFEAPEMKPYTGYGDLGAGTAANALLRKFEIDNQTKATESQTALNAANANKAAADALLANQRAQTEYWQGLYKAREYGIFDEFGEETSREQLELIKANQSKIKQDIEESKSRVDLNKSNISVNNQKIKNMQQDIRESLSRIGVNNARIGEITKNTALLGQKILESGLTQKQLQYVLDTNPDADITKFWNEQQNEINVMYKKLQLELQDASGGQTSPLMYLITQLSRLGR